MAVRNLSMVSSPGSVDDYDLRYHHGYLADFEGLYESCRLEAVRHTLKNRQLFPVEPTIVADIACGQGRYGPVIKKAFPHCRIVAIDFSLIALKQAAKSSSGQFFFAGACEAIPLRDEAVELVFSIETLEHVLDARATIQEWSRILNPGGRILMTTPCANKFSLEWFMMYFTGGLQPTKDGVGRFRRDEPGHLRRLASRNLRDYFAEVGIRVIHARFRTHFFTTVSHGFLSGKFMRLARFFASLDWRLLRRFPNGASMLIVGEKIGN
jgi:ubiquinone/menaquinone biosynthesis C-methylase UbiE